MKVAPLLFLPFLLSCEPVEFLDGESKTQNVWVCYADSSCEEQPKLSSRLLSSCDGAQPGDLVFIGTDCYAEQELLCEARVPVKCDKPA